MMGKKIYVEIGDSTVPVAIDGNTEQEIQRDSSVPRTTA